MIGPLFGSAQLDNTFAVLGNSSTPILGATQQQLLRQIIVAAANRSGGGTGTVTDVSLVQANGVQGSVENPTTTPAITLDLTNLVGINAKSYGDVGLARKIDGVTVSTNTVTSASGPFLPSDNGRLAYLAVSTQQMSTVRTVTYVSATQITLSGASLTAYDGGDVVIYTQDDADALLDACAAAREQGIPLHIPAGGYVINKACLSLNYSTLTPAPAIVGDGALSTRFFIAPDYDYVGGLGFGDALLTDIRNCSGFSLSGVGLYGGYQNPGVNHAGMYIHSCFGLMRDVRVTSLRGGVVAAVYVSACQMVLDRLHVEGNAGYGINIDGSTAWLSNSYHGNGTNLPGLQVENDSTVVQYGGTQDESTVGNMVIRDSGTKYTLIGGRVEGLAGAYSIKVEAGVAKFIACLIRPFEANANNGGIDIDSGAVVECSGCTIEGNGTRFSVLNAGTFIDGGGNTLAGTGLSSTGSVYALSVGAYKAPATAGFPQFAAAGVSTGMRAYDDGTSNRRVDFWMDGNVKATVNEASFALNSLDFTGVNRTITAAATTGAQEINKSSGSVNFAAGATSLVVTNSLVTTNSVIFVTVATNDATFKSAQAVAASGSFTIFADAAATAETRVNFIVM
jgi:hypothetical protein